MLTSLQQLFKFSSLLALITLLIAVFFVNFKSDIQTIESETFDLKEKVYVTLSPFPVAVEDEINVHLRLTEPLAKSDIQLEAWIEGVNMYMGRSKVVLNSKTQDGAINGVFFIGSCSEPKMQWRFYLKMTNKNGEEEVLSFDFFTDQWE